MSAPIKFSPSKSSDAKNETNVKAAVLTPNSLKLPNRKHQLNSAGNNGEQPPTKVRKVEDRELWKLAKGKYMLGFYLCSDDWNRLYNNNAKVVRTEDGRFAVNFELCAECTLKNARATDLLAPPKQKKSAE